MERTDVVVIGGGLAGLAAAATAARAGARVTVLEARDHLGGRGDTEEREGFLLNRGPHALYEAGAGRGVLRELGIDPRGGAPLTPLGVRLGDRVAPLPLDARGLVRTPLLSWPAKAEWARVAQRLRSFDPRPLSHVPLAEWLDQEVRQPVVRNLVELLVRVSSYCNAPDLMSAGAAIQQVQLAMKGVRYLDGGWQTLVRALADVAGASGATTVVGDEVTALGAEAGRWTVRTAAGSWEAAAVVVAAGGPDLATRLLGMPSWFAVAPPITAASLDLGLPRLPEHPVLFGVDRPLYFSTHSPPAALAPTGHVLATALRYHVPGEELDHHAGRRELEEHAAVAGIDDRDVVVRRYLHRSVVSYGLPLAAAGGLAGRPQAEVPGRAGAFIAGDWVGGAGHLADASLASGRAAGRAAAAVALDAGVGAR